MAAGSPPDCTEVKLNCGRSARRRTTYEAFVSPLAAYRTTERLLRKDKGDQKPGSVSNSTSSCQTGSAAKGNDNNNKTENPLKRHVNVEELKKFFD